MAFYTDSSTSTTGPGKPELRTTLLSARAALPAATLAEAAEALLDRLDELIRRHRPPLTVCAYVPVGTEPGGPQLPARLAQTLDPGTLLLPVLRPDRDLDWAAYAGPQSLAPVGRGLREPTGARLGVAAIAQAQLVLVPALAVDRHGMRLGRGGGSYDRALARSAPSALVVALLHDGELLARVPAEPHDQPVDAVLTPHGVTMLHR